MWCYSWRSTNIINNEVMSSNHRINVFTKYGCCSMLKHHHSSGITPTIQTAINKNEYFANMATEIHGNYYTYDKVDYVNSIMKVMIKCPEHGYFYQTPNSHLSGKGCIKCARVKSGKSRRNSTDLFIKRSNITHNFKYKYDKSIYTNQSDHIIIICPIHGEFIIRAKSHLRGRGCHKCARESISRSRKENPTG